MLTIPTSAALGIWIHTITRSLKCLGILDGASILSSRPVVSCALDGYVHCVLLICLLFWSRMVSTLRIIPDRIVKADSILCSFVIQPSVLLFEFSIFPLSHLPISSLLYQPSRTGFLSSSPQKISLISQPLISPPSSNIPVDIFPPLS